MHLCFGRGSDRAAAAPFRGDGQQKQTARLQGMHSPLLFLHVSPCFCLSFSPVLSALLLHKSCFSPSSSPLFSHQDFSEFLPECVWVLSDTHCSLLFFSSLCPPSSPLSSSLCFSFCLSGLFDNTNGSSCVRGS